MKLSFLNLQKNKDKNFWNEWKARKTLQRNRSYIQKSNWNFLTETIIKILKHHLMGSVIRHSWQRKKYINFKSDQQKLCIFLNREKTFFKNLNMALWLMALWGNTKRSNVFVIKVSEMGEKSWCRKYV